MRKNSLFIVLSLILSVVSAQELVKSFSFADGYLFSPKMVLETDNRIVVPYYITKEAEKKAGVLYLNTDYTLNDAILFQGENSYVINEVLESENGNLLFAAEGYSFEGQESLYFIELNENNTIVNEFIFNENGNELDPFAILEEGNNILVAGFIKSRELVSSAFINMYSEKQMIYFGKFTKDGQKQWAKAIDLEGYENGICNQIIKQGNDIIMLCHANKIGEEISTFLIKIDSQGEIKKIVNLKKSNVSVLGSKLLNDVNQIKLVGSYMSEENYFFKYTFNNNLDFVEAVEHKVPGKILINYFNNDIALGSILKDKSYNNLIINVMGSDFSLKYFGSNKTNILVGANNQSYFGYNLINEKGVVSTFDVYSNVDSKLKKELFSKQIKNQSLTVETVVNYTLIDEFLKSSINKGISKVKVENVKSKFLSK